MNEWMKKWNYFDYIQAFFSPGPHSSQASASCSFPTPSTQVENHQVRQASKLLSWVQRAQGPSHHLLGVSSWAAYFTFLCLSFLLCKIRITISSSILKMM